MSPEVLKSEPYNCQCDVYSYGMTLYELVARQLPWNGRALWDIAPSVIEGKRPTYPEGIEVNPELHAVIEWCWSQNPEDRPRMSEVVQRLHPMMEKELADTLGSDSKTKKYLEQVSSRSASSQEQSMGLSTGLTPATFASYTLGTVGLTPITKPTAIEVKAPNTSSQGTVGPITSGSQSPRTGSRDHIKSSKDILHMPFKKHQKGTDSGEKISPPSSEVKGKTTSPINTGSGSGGGGGLKASNDSEDLEGFAIGSVETKNGVAMATLCSTSPTTSRENSGSHLSPRSHEGTERSPPLTPKDRSFSPKGVQDTGTVLPVDITPADINISPFQVVPNSITVVPSTGVDLKEIRPQNK